MQILKRCVSGSLTALICAAVLLCASKAGAFPPSPRALALLAAPGMHIQTETAVGSNIVLNDLTVDEAELPDTEDYGDYLLPQKTISPSLTPPAGGRPLTPLTVRGSSTQTHYGNLYIKNPTTAKIDAETVLKAPLKWSFDSSGPQILIVHTHGSESYNPHGGIWWLPSDNSRSLDITENIVAVGADLARILHNAGFSVLHSTTMYDQPTYSTSYSSALKGINAYLKQYPSIRMVIDIHRDAMSNETTKYKLVSEINGEDCAQLMFVMGTGLSGLSFPNWRENLAFAAKVQSAVLDRYPTLMRPITITKHRYNEHTTRASVILEVGTDGNTLEEAKRSINYFGEVLVDVLAEIK
ncbi:MAG: stage II sporulation protein P [Clostridia bacterium]|nr:stage II sporulation protein P [Clostridia bacterium]